MRRLLAVPVVLLALTSGTPAAVIPYLDQEVALERADPLVEMSDFRVREVRRAGFRLTAAQDVRVQATGAETGSWGRFSWVRAMWRDEDRRRPWAGNAWILDLASRRVVWELSAERTSDGGRGTRTFDGSVRLQPGTYAAYYGAFPDQAYAGTGEERSGLDRLWDAAAGRFALRIEGSGVRLKPEDLARADAAVRAGAAVALDGSGAGRFQQAGFRASQRVEVDVAATGELQDGAEFDSAWIVNADTRERIWKMTWDGSAPAGGAGKNRTARRTLTLPPGRYAVFFGTDDSHDPTGWNAQPPHDPASWGVVVRARSGGAALEPFTYEHVPEAATIVALTRVGDGESRQKGFSLARAMDVRIYALGEGRENGMFDYAWITGADSRRRVWQMRWEDSDPAGGDPKNRVVDTVIRLEKGSYVVHYVSDDSHAYGGWNAPAPPDAAHWGVTLLAADGRLDRAAVGDYSERADPSLLAAIARVRDDDRVQKRFSLAAESRLRVAALGEGTGGEMHDYGWIEDVRTGRRVWEMTYRTTEHAGGAAKNRRFDGVLVLPAGEYALFYETDGSHAFGDWNAAPPDDPEGWGITVYRTQK